MRALKVADDRERVTGARGSLAVADTMEYYEHEKERRDGG